MAEPDVSHEDGGQATAEGPPATEVRPDQAEVGEQDVPAQQEPAADGPGAEPTAAGAAAPECCSAQPAANPAAEPAPEPQPEPQPQPQPAPAPGPPPDADPVATADPTLDVPSVSAALGPGARFGPYEIDAEIARGGMGVLYRAHDTRAGDASPEARALPADVALKVVLRRRGNHSHEADVTRFIEEVRALIRLRHPNIVRIYDAGREQGVHFYTMERIEGPSMRLLLQEGPIPLVMALDVAHKAALALARLHSAGFIHRDVKPDNILLDRRRSPFRPVLIDFGLILAERSRGGGFPAEVAGTPAYMAPEQTSAKGRYGDLGPWTDVYGLGATLYCLLSGRPPFLGHNPQEMLKAIRSTEPRRLRSMFAGLPRRVEAVIEQAMAKTPGRRYASMDVLADDLGSLVDALRRDIRASGAWLRIKRALRLS